MFKETVTTNLFKNKHGEFPEGTPVYFSVENQFSGGWMSDTHGILKKSQTSDDWVIETRQGIVTINKGYDAYHNTIIPIARADA
jgi:hypothetical protein